MLGKLIKRLKCPLLIAGILVCLVTIVHAAAGNIDPTEKWAWSTNVGWINFAPDNGGVKVYSDHLEGYAWAENVGWIRLGTHTNGSPHTYANTTQDDYGVNNDGTGNLSGYAWGTNVGWINFNPDGDKRVTIHPDTGSFDGYAWGENIGWISFKGAGDTYKVRTGWRADAPMAVGGYTEPWSLLSSARALLLLGALVGLVAGALRALTQRAI